MSRETDKIEAIIRATETADETIAADTHCQTLILYEILKVLTASKEVTG